MLPFETVPARAVKDFIENSPKHSISNNKVVQHLPKAEDRITRATAHTHKHTNRHTHTNIGTHTHTNIGTHTHTHRHTHT